MCIVVSTVYLHTFYYFFKCLGRQKWMDGVGSVWMMPSQLDKRSQLGFGFSAGLAGLGFP
jgi:hypothetical protein